MYDALLENAPFSVVGQTVLSLAYNQATRSSLTPWQSKEKRKKKQAKLHKRGFLLLF